MYSPMCTSIAFQGTKNKGIIKEMERNFNWVRSPKSEVYFLFQKPVNVLFLLSFSYSQLYLENKINH